MKRKFSTVIFFFLLIGIAQASSPIKINVADGNLALKADNISFQKVLEELSNKTGIKVKYIGDIETKNDMVNVNIQSRPFERGVRELLRDWNHVLVKDDKTSAIIKIMILGKLRDGEATNIVDSDGEVMRVATSTLAEPVIQTVRDALQRVNDAKTPERKASAILGLASYQNSDTLGVLKPALDDKDESIRQAALESMRSSYLDDPETLAKVREMALNDPASQRQALEVLVRYDASEEGKSVLQKIAAEGDGATSNFAKQELRRMEHEKATAHTADTQIQQQIAYDAKALSESGRADIPASRVQDNMSVD